jgi:subtilisin family serine protease
VTPPLPGAGAQPLQRSVVSRLLTGSPGVDDATRQQLLVTIDGRHAVLVELSLPAGAIAQDVRGQFGDVFQAAFGSQVSQPPAPIPISGHYLRCLLTQDEITALARQDASRAAARPPLPRTIYRVWPDYRVRAHIDQSCSTIQADAAARTYGVTGAGIVWALVDSGIDATHPHFSGGTVSDPVVARLHRDFTGLLQPSGIASADPAPALTDALGHGTHVAGIIAGQAPDPAKVVIAVNEPSTDDLPAWATRSLDPGRSLQGMAPLARLVSLKVLDDGGDTVSSAVIAALAQIREYNADGSRLQIHGVNLSIGCDWFPDEFAAGQSPLCRELDLLVATGVVAVVSAGNSGAGGTLAGGSSDVHGRLSTISDPGNSLHAITVGSTHRSAPHTYGVTYTSSKGPTLDGRPKPDLVAPGERITSAATGTLAVAVPPLQDALPGAARYVEDSGTSMAAPHVSGAIAAFLSVRQEYIGQPEEIKKLFLASATSLDRHEFYQGAGLLDLMRVLSSV